MSPERVIAIGAGIITVGMLGILPGAVSEYRFASRAEHWEAKTGYVDEMTDNPPTILMFYRHEAGHAQVGYRFEGRDGNWVRGGAQVPRTAGIHKDARIEIRYNPENNAESLPAASISSYKSGNGRTILFVLAACAGMCLVTRHLWREGGQRNGMAS